VLRAVLDAILYASALIKPEGPTGRILHLLLADQAFEVILSESILLELRRCLGYPKLRKFIRLTGDEIDRWILALELIADMVKPIRKVRAVSDDPDDDHLLAAALEGRAAFLVTGDQHVLALVEFEGVRIVSPAGFLKVLGRPKRAW
jgi:putative PIN family toxin of toxin-antitoxin system